MNQPIPKFVLVDDENYRLSDPCDSEAEARAQADFISECSPIRHVCRVCPSCGEHEVYRRNAIAFGIETSWLECQECEWTGDPE
jgi:hypothetical protein